MGKHIPRPRATATIRSGTHSIRTSPTRHYCTMDFDMADTAGRHGYKGRESATKISLTN